MTDIAGLLERVRAATGPDREIDLEILARVQQQGQWSEGDIFYGLTDVEGTTAPPAYTASVDAALALVERKLGGENDGPLLYARAGYWNADASDGMNFLQTFHVDVGTPPQMVEIESDGATEPLAILAALLSALSSGDAS